MPVRLTKAEKIKIRNADDIFGIMQRILLREDAINRNREHLWVVGLETNLRLQYVELVSMGSRTKTIVEPMEVFSLALQKKSSSIILVHNHPSGELKPSPADIDMTDKLVQVGKIVDVTVDDHLIISTTSFFSFRYSKMLDAVSRSTRYVPPYKLIERATKLAKESGEEKGKKDQAREIARTMKKDGLDPEMIAMYTGLKVGQIKRLKIKE